MPEHFWLFQYVILAFFSMLNRGFALGSIIGTLGLLVYYNV